MMDVLPLDISVLCCCPAMIHSCLENDISSRLLVLLPSVVAITHVTRSSLPMEKFYQVILRLRQLFPDSQHYVGWLQDFGH